jgi:broad specificity phosphatase PhoE
MTGRVLVIRHGRTALNADGRLRGHLDPPLDEVGRREAAAVAAVLSEFRIVRILSSPLLRALQTAGAIAEVAGCRSRPWTI